MLRGSCTAMIDERIDIEKTEAGLESVRPIENEFLAVHSSDHLTPPMLKLNVDCLEELFEWLPLADLRALRRTCKRLKQVVDYFIQLNFPSLQWGFAEVKLHSSEFEKFLALDAASLKKIKNISIEADTITTSSIIRIKEVLLQIEKLQISAEHIEGDFHECLLKWCENLKQLNIYNVSVNNVINEGRLWLHRQYPTIEHILLHDHEFGGPGLGWETPELRAFFEQNPNIQTFSTTFNFFWVNRHCWLESNIKLDRLNITGDCFYEQGMNRLCDLLNLLYDQGFYKRLHMYPAFMYEQDDLAQITSVMGLEKLYLGELVETTLSLLPNLKEICFRSGDEFDNIGRDVNKFVNLERVYFKTANSSVLQPFIEYAAKVKEIQIVNLESGTHSVNNIIDLVELNKQRKQLEGACKTTIYVQENIFLATKWALGNTHFFLVELKRADAVEWTHDFKK